MARITPAAPPEVFSLGLVTSSPAERDGRMIEFPMAGNLAVESNLNSEVEMGGTEISLKPKIQSPKSEGLKVAG
jgi:hypothetical protein